MISHHIRGIPQPVSQLCLGTSEFGSSIDVATANALMDRFAHCGGNFIDTAHVYGAWDPHGINHGNGNSEVVIGRWLKERGNREHIILGTKGGHPHFQTRASGLTPNRLLQQINESLQRLQTDFIDIYWLHRDDRSIPVSEILGWLEAPFKQGSIRTLGFSNWRIDRIAEAIAYTQQHEYPIIVIASQIASSLAQSLPSRKALFYGEELAMDTETSEFHRHTQFPLVAYSPQAEGFFAEKYDHSNFNLPNFPKPNLISKYGSKLNLQRRALALRMAQSKGCSTNQIALAWLLRQAFPSFAIIGPRSLEQLDNSISGTLIELNDNEYLQLQEPPQLESY